MIWVHDLLKNVTKVVVNTKGTWFEDVTVNAILHFFTWMIICTIILTKCFNKMLQNRQEGYLQQYQSCYNCAFQMLKHWEINNVAY